MSESIEALDHHTKAFLLRQKRDETRGYSINMKYLSIAFLGEGIVILTSLYGAWLFTKMYGMGDETAIHMMLLAPISYAVIEMCRIPLAIAARTQRSFIIRCLAIVGVIAAAGVTVKSMSQLGEIMFRPRLIEVRDTLRQLHKAENDLAGFQTVKEQAEAEVARLSLERQQTAESMKDGSSKVIALKCTPQQRTARSRDGTVRRWTVCVEPAGKKEMIAATVTSTDMVQKATNKLNEANDRLTALGNAQTRSDAVVTARGRHDNAVSHSQLHAFTGMVFAKDPTEVTNGEISQFLQIFVFVPAICVSLASTLLAMASVTRIKPRKDKGLVLVPASGAQYVLGPFAQEVVAKATEAAQKSIKEAMEKTSPAPTLKVA